MTGTDVRSETAEIAVLAGWMGIAGWLALLMHNDMTEVLALSADLAWVGDVALLFAFLTAGIYIPAKMYRQS